MNLESLIWLEGRNDGLQLKITLEIWSDGQSLFDNDNGRSHFFYVCQRNEDID